MLINSCYTFSQQEQKSQQTHKDSFHFLHFRGTFYPHEALFHLRYVSSFESGCWDVFFFLLGGESNYQTCLPRLNSFDYEINKAKACFIRCIENTENIHEASCTGCSAKFLVIFHLFIYLSEMNRADISLTNTTLLQTVWNQLVPVTAAAWFQKVIVLMADGAGKQPGWMTPCHRAAAHGWMSKCADCSEQQTNQ